MKRNFILKAQSAMEYLMTYGWAILIISVVLGALFCLGVFSGASLIGTSCIASPGFYCSGVTYSHSTGALTFVVGQSTGLNWVNTAFIYAPQGTAITSNGPTTTYANVLIPVFIPGRQTTIGWPVGAGAVAAGTTTAGSIWACYTVGTSSIPMIGGAGYCTAGTNTVYYTQIATLTAKAT